MNWTNLPTEVEGVRLAVRNLRGDTRQIAGYVYGQCCEYIGANHAEVAEALICAALEEVVRAAAISAQKEERK